MAPSRVCRTAAAAVCLALACAAVSVGAVEDVVLTVAYCPGDFSFAGGLVSVDVSTGKFTVVNKGVQWPTTSGDGCAITMDPTFCVDTHTETAYLDLSSDWGYVLGVSLTTGDIVKKLPAHDRLIYDGFTAFVPENVATPSVLIGVTPAVTQDGYCNDGCFSLVTQSLATGDVTLVANVPYKAVQTDVLFHDSTAGVVYVQASYPLTPAAYCAGSQTDQCIVGLSVSTGAIVTTVPTPTWEAYAYAVSTFDAGSSTVVAWVDGFLKECDDPYNDFGFARVSLTTGNATLLHCIPKDIVVHTDPATGGFSHDGSMFTTSSGNAETGELQLLVLDVTAGTVALNTSLPGLKSALGVSTDAPFIDVWTDSF